MRKITIITLLISLAFAVSGCGGKGGLAASGQQSAGSGCTYDFPQAGFGFELPEGVEITKGYVSSYDMGEISYNGHISMGWPVYWNFTEDELDNLTEADYDKVHTGTSFMILCSGEGRDFEKTKADYIAQIEKETGETISDEEIASLDELVLIHQEGDYTWYLAKNDKTEDIPEENQKEYDAFFDATDEIVKNMKFYEPQIWRGGDEGTAISFTTTDLDGNAVDSKDLFAQNKITMINIWGTYCGPCIEEMPELEEISRDYADKGVGVVGLVVDVTEGNDSKLSEANDIIRDTGVTYMNIKAWDGFTDQLSAPGTPTTYFVDSNGKLVGDPIVGANIMKYRQTLDDLSK
ncbi:MAG: TlpA family protein disulfide reductase [Lachnospiraceae bacterium]|nr:TlpA family protein disulfide reductase [Lachnospiraceae bacterium]